MARFDYFVVLAEMRTGSNFLEANLNTFDGISCLGEAFNPHFIGTPTTTELLGLTHKKREKDPLELIDRVKAQQGLAGFRLFHDHDPRAIDACLSDPRCAKIILTRNPVDAFVSLQIARATGQWKLTNVTHAKGQKIPFDAAEFEDHLQKTQDFQITVLNRLQRSGQAGFYLSYEDLQDLEVMNGLAAWLGIDGRITRLDKKLKKQNPSPMSGKVANLDEMANVLARMDRFNLTRTPNFEPRRGPMIPTYIAAARSPLLYLPIKSGPVWQVRRWLAALDKVEVSDLRTEFTQSSLRAWKRAFEGHRSFTVLRHPLARAHVAFCERILDTGPGTFDQIRKTLIRVHNLPLPETGADPETDPTYDFAAHRAAFLAFLKFLKANLAAQTGIRVDPHWASQLAVLQGYADFGMPDLILREDSLARDLSTLALQVGVSPGPEPAGGPTRLTERLRAIYDAEVEAAARAALGADYTAFGFGDWSA